MSSSSLATSTWHVMMRQFLNFNHFHIHFFVLSKWKKIENWSPECDLYQIFTQ